MIASQYYPLIGGYENAANRLAVELVRHGHTVSVITERRSSSWPEAEEIKGVKVIRLFSWFKPGFHSLTSIASTVFFLVMHGWKFDIWHIHEYGLKTAFVITIGKFLKRPVVLKFTSTGSYGIKKVLHDTQLGGFIETSHKSVDAAIAVSSEVADEAEGIGIPKSRVHKIPNGVDVDIFHPYDETKKAVTRIKLAAPDNQFIIFVGRLAPEKNIESLLEAWSLVDISYQANWKLLIVGDGPLQKYLKDLAQEYGVNHSVVFLGESSNVVDWLGISDIYVLTSNAEGLSNSLLEAMSVGLPVITTNVSGVKDLRIDDNAGFVVPVGDIQALSRRLDYLMYSKSKRQEMGLIARSIILDNYSVKHVAKRYEALYKSLT